MIEHLFCIMLFIFECFMKIVSYIIFLSLLIDEYIYHTGFRMFMHHASQIVLS